MRHFVIVSMLVLSPAVIACGPRPVQVQTGQRPTTEVALHVTNNLSQGVNVYVSSGGPDVFLKQVPAHSTLDIPVPGLAAGTTVTLRATPQDGSRTYTRERVTLAGVYAWQIP